MFGAHPYELDHGMFMQYHLDDMTDPAPPSIRLRKMDKELFSIIKKAQTKDDKNYGKAVKQQNYELGEEVYVFNILGLTYTGRKLRRPWFGPYMIIERCQI